MMIKNTICSSFGCKQFVAFEDIDQKSISCVFGHSYAYANLLLIIDFTTETNELILFLNIPKGEKAKLYPFKISLFIVKGRPN